MTVWAYSIIMDAPSQAELDSIQAVAQRSGADQVIHWQSAFGLIVIEVRGGEVFVNGQRVVPVTNRGDRLSGGQAPGDTGGSTCTTAQ